MSCSCRAAPWRSFLRGLVQVHQLQVPSSRGGTLISSSTTSPLLPLLGYGSRVILPGRDRGLRTSACRAQDAIAAALLDPVELTAGSRDVESNDGAFSTEVRLAKGKSGGLETRIRKSKKWLDMDIQPDAEGPSWKSKPGSSDQSQRPRIKRTPKPDTVESGTTISTTTTAPTTLQPKIPREAWQSQKQSLKEKFPDGWKPRKRLSPDALAGIRALNAQFPDVYTTQALADKFEVSAEAIRRILKSKWQPSVDEEQGRQDRWFRRGQQVWEQKAALGVKPPKKWRSEGIARDPSYHEWSKKASRREKEWEEEEVRKYKAQRARMQDRSSGRT